MSRYYNQFLCSLALIVLCATHLGSLHGLSSLAKNDPFPLFSSLPDFLLYKREILEIMDPEVAVETHSRAGLSLSVFSQNANTGRNYRGEQFLPQKTSFATSVGGTCTTDIPTCIGGIPVELGDLTGRINMIPLVYGPTPEGATLPPALVAARDALFPGVTGVINDETLIDPDQRYASFSFPLKYRKRGMRVETGVNISESFGINVQAGLANISQTVLKPFDLTCDAGKNCNTPSNCSVTDACQFVVPAADAPAGQNNVEQYLMQQFKIIAKELGINIGNFNKTSFDEIRLNIYARHGYEMNLGKDAWPHIIIMPFAVASVSISPGEKLDPSKLFGVYFGNNGHPAVGGLAGISVFFVETIEIDAEVGATYFVERTVPCMRVPNNEFQKTMFPFTTSAHVKPGYNWHFGARLSAYHFLDNLSMYFQYVMVNHAHDQIELKCADSAFVPEALERVTAWKTKLANIGFNYDISPNVALGFLWQAPLSQRNTYRSTTVMGSFNVTF
jgi:hypothetical protein